MSVIDFQNGLRALTEYNQAQLDAVDPVEFEKLLMRFESVFGSVKPRSQELLVDTPEERSRRILEERVCGVFIKITDFCRAHQGDFPSLKNASLEKVAIRLTALHSRFSMKLVLSEFSIDHLFKSSLKSIYSNISNQELDWAIPI